MKVRRQKTARRILRFYRTAFGIQQPYRVLVDGTFISHALRHKIHIKEQLPKILCGRATPVVTGCIMAELRSLGKRALGAALIAKGYYRIQCGHDEPLPAAECIRQHMDKKNERRFLLATQDAELVNTVRQMMGVPLIRLNNQVPVLEDPSEASKAHSRSIEAKKSLPASWEISKLPQLKAAEAATKAKAAAGRKKRKGPKGPNPLSCKRPKQRGPEAPEPPQPDAAAPKKRQRSRKMGTKIGGAANAIASRGASTGDAEQ